jgi:radical SAM protein with 4Fe4S-binding SPASM domain
MADELSPAELSSLFREIVSLSAEKVVFTGGEPLLRDDLVDVAHAFREADPSRRICLCLISNGMSIDAEAALWVARAFDQVRISVDGPETVNDELRGGGAFQGAMRAILHLRNAGLEPSVSMTVTAASLPHLPGFLTWLLDEILVTDFHLAPFRPIGRGAEHPALVCSWREAQLAVADFWRRRFGPPLRLGTTDAYTLVGCRNCGIGSYINIQPDGGVYPCHVLSVPEFRLGNVRGMGLTEIVRNSSILRQLENLDFIRLAEAKGPSGCSFKDAVCLGEIYRDAPEVLLDRLKGSP